MTDRVDQNDARASAPPPLVAEPSIPPLLDQAFAHLRTAELFAQTYTGSATYVMTPVSIVMAQVHASIGTGLIALAQVRGGRR